MVKWKSEWEAFTFAPCGDKALPPPLVPQSVHLQSLASLNGPSHRHLMFQRKTSNGCLSAALRNTPPPSPVFLSSPFCCRWQHPHVTLQSALRRIHVFTFIAQRTVPKGQPVPPACISSQPALLVEGGWWRGGRFALDLLGLL